MPLSAKDKLKQQFYLDSKSPAIIKALKDCEQVAGSAVNILIIGESGTGKEVAAKYIHACSSRATEPFIAINCNAYTESLLESELFGHEQGAFTGATKRRVGKFELAHKGTLFLDEVGDISLTTQTKLLRTLETKEIERIGSNQKQHIEFRLIAATNKDLPAEIQQHAFREDFFYRISTIVIRMPPLRERKEDLIDLIHHFLAASQAENNITITDIKPAVWDFLLNYHYPGNIRELRNIIDRMVVLSNEGIITENGIPILYDIHPAPQVPAFSSPALLTWKEFKQKSEADYLRQVLTLCQNNVTEAARKLEISSRQLYNKIQEYNLR